jgi:predicted enzyme related to lactoylglutathione lyase
MRLKQHAPHRWIKDVIMPVTGIDASYYYAKDLGRAVAFYNDLFAMEPEMHVPDMFAEWVFQGGEAFGLYKGDEYKPGNGMMFAVPDIQAAVKDLTAKGVAVHGEIEDTPVCHMAFGTDSEGNGFILHQRK